jgi:hypothetical protein
MLMAPDWIGADMFQAAVAKVAGGEKATSLDKLRLVTLDEGLCVQTLHIGSFDDEGDILDQMHNQFIPEHGLHMVKKHHEIYFSDLRKTAPDKLRTILRQPFMNA